MKTSIKSIYPMKVTLLIRTLLACLVVVAFSFAVLPTWAGDPEADAKEAFDKWKAAAEGVAEAKKKLKEANESLTNMMVVVASGGITEGEEAALAKARAKVAAAEAALKDAEAKLDAARIALEEAIAALPDSSELKKELIRKRDGYIAAQRFAATVSADAVTVNGMRIANFDTANGRVIVNLPDDMHAGDTISGTVMAEPKGQTPEERAKNMGVLSGCVIEIEPPKKPDGTSNPKVTAQVTATPSPFTFTLPPSSPPTPPRTNVSSSDSGSVGITLTNVSGSFTIPGTITVPIEIVSLSLQSVEPVTVFQLPTIAQQGKPVEITSGNRNFDGNSATTNCRVAGQPVVILAESPNKVVFESPTNVTGPVEIVLIEGNQETKGTYRNVGVNLSAPKTNLLKGERTTLTVQVSGLEGIKEPVPLTLECKGVIKMEGGTYQPLVIQPSQVSADGRYTTTRGITGVQTGGWTATATVVTHKFDVCLQDDSVPARVVLWNTFTGDYVFSCPGCLAPRGQPSVTAGPARAQGSSTDRPSGLMGKGSVTRKGCIITLTHNAPDRRIHGTLDPCTDSGSTMIETPQTGAKFRITDRNTADNVCLQAGILEKLDEFFFGSVPTKDELLQELEELRKAKRYDCAHGKKYQKDMADRIAAIKKALRGFHREKVLNDPIDETC